MANYYVNGKQVSRTYALDYSLRIGAEQGSDPVEVKIIFLHAESDEEDSEYWRDDLGNVTDQQVEIVL